MLNIGKKTEIIEKVKIADYNEKEYKIGYEVDITSITAPLPDRLKKVTKGHFQTDSQAIVSENKVAPITMQILDDPFYFPKTEMEYNSTFNDAGYGDELTVKTDPISKDNTDFLALPKDNSIIKRRGLSKLPNREGFNKVLKENEDNSYLKTHFLANVLEEDLLFGYKHLFKKIESEKQMYVYSVQKLELLDKEITGLQPSTSKIAENKRNGKLYKIVNTKSKHTELAIALMANIKRLDRQLKKIQNIIKIEQQRVAFNAVRSSKMELISTIKNFKKGAIFFTEDFLSYGTTKNISKTLQNLVEKKEIIRVARGLYTCPDTNKSGDTLIPSMEAIAKAIARREGTRIIPTGLYSLNILGLSTQTAIDPVYLTDGVSRKVTIGKRSILFKKTTPKNLVAIGEISALVIQGLKVLGKEQISEGKISKIVEVLRKEKTKHLRHDIHLAPEWIRSIMKAALPENLPL